MLGLITREESSSGNVIDRKVFPTASSEKKIHKLCNVLTGLERGLPGPTDLVTAH